MEFNENNCSKTVSQKVSEAQITDETVKSNLRQPMQHRPAWDSMIICI